MKLGRIPGWLWALGGGTVIAGVIVKLALGEDEVSPEDVALPVAASGDYPNFPFVTVGPGHYLAVPAGNAFNAMKQAALLDGIQLPISTAWRSREYQQRLYDAYQAYLAGGPWAPMAAKPGSSKHEVGLALDLNGLDPGKSNFNTQRRLWMDTYSASFGWKNTGLTFKSREPWHFEWSTPSVA